MTPANFESWCEGNHGEFDPHGLGQFECDVQEDLRVQLDDVGNEVRVDMIKERGTVKMRWDSRNVTMKEDGDAYVRTGGRKIPLTGFE